MEKYGVQISDQKKGLLQEEAELMTELSKYNSPIPPAGEKTAGEAQRKREGIQERLMSVRGKLSELDKEESAE